MSQRTRPNLVKDKAVFGIDQVELEIKSDPALGDGSGVAHLAQRPVHRVLVSSRNNGGCLVGDANLKSNRTPAHKLDDGLSFGGGF